MKYFLQEFNYDVFTIPTTPDESDLTYKQIMKNMKKAKYGNVLMLCDKEIEANGKHWDRARLLRGTIRQLMGNPRNFFDFLHILSKTDVTCASGYCLGCSAQLDRLMWA